MPKRTPLYDMHSAGGAKMVDFGGWDMPLHYGSQVEEHHVVRRSSGMFDVSHMTILDIRGPRVGEFLRHLLANDVAKLKTAGKALYSCMLNERGGVIDDLIVYYLDTTWYRVVVNAATRDKDMDWIRRQATAFGVKICERRDTAMIAVQGPQARELVHEVLGDVVHAATALMTPFSMVRVEEIFIARTGYTGEDGYELMLPAADAPGVWARLAAAGVRPCGLGARDTLRLEAGMNLYGLDMDENTTPLESGLAWTVAWEPAERDFIGRAALEEQRRNGVPRTFVGLVLKGKGVLRSHQSVIAGDRAVGETTSGSFSPTLGAAIAFARVEAGTQAGPLQVEIRGQRHDVAVVKPPFVRNGKATIAI